MECLVFWFEFHWILFPRVQLTMNRRWFKQWLASNRRQTIRVTSADPVHWGIYHYTDVIMTTIASQITSLMVVYSIVYSEADQSKHQSSASLAFVWGIHRDRWIPRTKGQLRGKCFHLMTSSCAKQGADELTTLAGMYIIWKERTTDVLNHIYI